MQFTTFALAALSMGSAIAGPIAGFPAFDQATTAVAQVKAVVQVQLGTINTLIKGDLDIESVDQIRESLLTIGVNVNGLLTPVLSLGNIGTSTLNDKQISSVPLLTADLQAIFVAIKTVGEKVKDSKLEGEALALIQPELQWVLSSVAPVTRPVLAFVQQTVPGSGALLAKLSPVLVDIQGLLTVTLAPVKGLLGGLGLSIL